MTIRFDVRADTRAMTRDLNKVQKRIVPRVTVQAMNRAARKIQTDSVRAISKNKGIKQKLIRGRFRIFKATRKRMSATVQAFVLGIKSGDLGNPRKTKTGARVGRHTFPGQFVATMKSGRTGVFARKFPDRHGKQRRRGIDGQELPIVEATVPLQPEAEKIINRVGNTIGVKFFKKEFNRLLAVRLKRRG